MQTFLELKEVAETDCWDLMNIRRTFASETLKEYSQIFIDAYHSTCNLLYGVSLR
jgi:hypothetical protein